MNVEFFQSAGGSFPVIDYCRGLAADQRHLVGDRIRAIQDTGGVQVPGVTVKPIRGKLMEIRISYHRIFYVIHGGAIWLLHAYQKDTNKTPQREIDVALARMAEVLRG